MEAVIAENLLSNAKSLFAPDLFKHSFGDAILRRKQLRQYVILLKDHPYRIEAIFGTQ